MVFDKLPLPALSFGFNGSWSQARLRQRQRRGEGRYVLDGTIIALFSIGCIGMVLGIIQEYRTGKTRWLYMQKGMLLVVLVGAVLYALTR